MYNTYFTHMCILSISSAMLFMYIEGKINKSHCAVRDFTQFQKLPSEKI